ncbi:hypothetical protein BN1708_018505, partial [Verticillium longisporum]
RTRAQELILLHAQSRRGLVRSRQCVWLAHADHVDPHDELAAPAASVHDPNEPAQLLGVKQCAIVPVVPRAGVAVH